MQNIDNLKHKGIFTLVHIRNGEVIGEDSFSNIIVDEGRDYVANSSYNNKVAAQTGWYVALYGNNVAPSASLTASNVSNILGELNVEIAEASRPQWLPDTDNTGVSSSNSDSVAVFTMTANDTIYGAFFISSSVKAGTTGVLLAASEFTPSRSVQIGDVLNLTYEIQLT